METIHFVQGDATRPSIAGPKVIVHVCNDIGGWGKGFVLALSQRWKEPELAYRKWSKGEGEEPFTLGQVQFVQVEGELWVANLIGQRGTKRTGGKPPVRYEAIAEGLERVAVFACQIGASVHMPRIGCGLAGGEWSEIEPLITQFLTCKDIPVTVYDFTADK